MKFFAVAALIMLFAMPAKAEQQIYSPYPVQSFGDMYGRNDQPPPPAWTPPKANERRVYPGREVYGEKFGQLTRHPGDYRDAVSRGSWDASPRPSPYGIFSLR